MAHRVAHLHTIEVINLTARKNRGKNLMLLRSGKNENRMRWRFLQSFEESIESSLRKHVHLVDDKHLITSHLWGNLHLVYEFSNVIYGVIRGGIELMDIIRASFVECHTTFTMITGFSAFSGRETVDRFCEDARRSRLTHATRSTEKIGMCQLSCCNRVLERSGKRTLSYHTIEVGGTIFASRYNVV